MQKVTRKSNVESALNWIDSELEKEDLRDFYLEPHIWCKSFHHILRLYKNELLNRKGWVLDNAYYQVKKMKDNYETYKMQAD